MSNNKLIEQGWECPKCKKVYAPWMPSCTSCPPKILSSSTSGNSWIGGISSVAQPIPEEYVVRGQSQPREYHKDLTIIKRTMSNNKQSSVEWYANEENKLFTSYQKGLMSTAKYILFKYKLREQAKAMHKEEILKLYNDFQDYLDEEFKNQCGGQGNILTFEQYYNVTFGGNNETT